MPKKLVNDAYTQHEYTKEEVAELYRCSQDIFHFAENYCVVIHPKRGKLPCILRDYQKRFIEAMRDNPKVVCLASRQIGKALDIETDILTPKGFVKLKNLSIGDKIFGPDGKQTKITFITEEMINREVYNITFSTGETIKADSEHLWNVNANGWNKTKTLTTKEMIPILLERQNRRKPECLYITTNKPLQLESQELVIDPYILGVWIGDGNRSQPRITCDIGDYENYNNQFLKRGYAITEFKHDKRSDRTGYFGIKNLTTKLKTEGLFQNKHLPKKYLLGSIEQRLDLLRGLMDTDGYCNAEGTCQFYQSNESIIDDVYLLLSSLGIKASKTSKKTTHKDCFILTFVTDLPIFTLERKLIRSQLKHNHPKNKRIYIRSIELTTSVPVRCLQVDNESHLFLCGRTLIPTHNTTSVSVFVLWYAMFNPDKCCAILANIDRTAMSILSDIKTMYEHLPMWLKPGCKEWNAHTINFDNGSKIFSAATSKNGIAGESVSFLYVDEMALIEPHIADEFWKANYPTVEHGEKVVVTSTPRGIGNVFYNIWKEAQEKANGFQQVRIDYWEFEEYRSPEWKEKQVRTLGIIGFNSEYGNQFIGSAATLITAEALQKMKEREFLEEIKINGGYQRWYEMFDKKWLDPRAKSFYIASADIGMGSGNDYSTLQIFRGTWRQPNIEDLKIYEERNEDPPEAIIEQIKQCYTFRSNVINIPDFCKFVFETLPDWGNPFFIFENNGIGQSFLDQMMENYSYENAYVHSQPGMTTYAFGINSNVATKTKAINSLKKYIETGRMEICDRELINELLTYIEKKSPSGGRRFTAEDGSHDDLAVGAAWACFMLETNWLQDCLTFTA